MRPFDARSLTFKGFLRAARRLLLMFAGLLTAALACGHVSSSGVDAGPPVVAQNVGPGGGIISLGGLTLTIPPGALTGFETITITQTVNPVPLGYVAYSPVYTFDPDGLNFAIPAILSMPFSGDPTRATLFWSQPNGSGYDRLAAQVVNGAAVGDVTHFSSGFVGVEAPADASEDATDAAIGDVMTDGGDAAFSLPSCGTILQASVDSQGNSSDGVSTGPVAISQTGRYVAFASNSTVLIPNDTNGTYHVFVHDFATGNTDAVSVSSNGTLGNASSGLLQSAPTIAISADGRFVAFASQASNLAPGTNGTPNLFVRDRVAKTTELINVAGDGGAVALGLYFPYPTISADGRFVAFLTAATGLVPGQVDGGVSIILRDRQTLTTTLASPSIMYSQIPTVTADGHFVMFQGSFPNTLYAFDIAGGVLNPFWTGNLSGLSPSGDGGLVLSEMGTYPGDGGVPVPAHQQLFDRGTMTTTNLTALDPATSSPPDGVVALSIDGTAVGIITMYGFDPRDMNQTWDLYTYDVATKAVNLTSRGLDGAASGTILPGKGNFALTADARWAAFAATDSEVYLAPTGCP